MSWRTVKLAELIDNFSVRAKDVGGAEGLDFYGVSNEEGIIKTKYAAEDKAEDYKIIEKGCFAYNPYRVNVGSIGLVSDETKGLISPAYVIFKPKPKSIIPELLFKFLKSDEGLRQIIFYARGTVRQALRFEDLCNIEISIPDYSVQEILYNKLMNSQKSSNVLDAELKNQLDLVKKLRQQLLQDAVQGKLVGQNKKDESASELLKKIKTEKGKLRKGNVIEPIIETSIPFKTPNNWIWCKFGEVIQMTRGKFSIRPRNDPSYFGGEYPFIQIGSLDEKGSVINESKQTLNEKGIKVSKKFPKNTIAIAIVGGTIANLGVLGREMYFTDSIIGILPNQFYNQEYILNYLRYKQPEIKSEAYQMAGQPNIKIPTLENLLFPMPPLAEQNRIVQKLDELMQYCNELEASIKQSESQNEKLLQQVLREALRKEPVGV